MESNGMSRLPNPCGQPQLIARKETRGGPPCRIQGNLIVEGNVFRLRRRKQGTACGSSQGAHFLAWLPGRVLSKQGPPVPAVHSRYRGKGSLPVRWTESARQP